MSAKIELNLKCDTKTVLTDAQMDEVLHRTKVLVKNFDEENEKKTVEAAVKKEEEYLRTHGIPASSEKLHDGEASLQEYRKLHAQQAKTILELQDDNNRLNERINNNEMTIRAQSENYQNQKVKIHLLRREIEKASGVLKDAYEL